jgi:ribokinase
MTRIAVVGHIEWVDFLRVDHLPVSGDLLAAERESVHAGGGAVVAAAVLAEHGAEVDIFCAIGSDDNGDAAMAELTGRGITVHAARRPGPTRQVITMLDHDGERTIVTVGERLQPQGSDELDWARLAEAEGVYVTAGDAGALCRAREARVLVATPRILERLERPDVRIDALVFSSSDPAEVRWAESMDPPARLMVATEGDQGGRWWGESEGRWPSVAPDGPVRDSYGCGDSFAAGFTLGLAQGRSPLQAAEIGARFGATMLTRVGAP